MRRMIESWSDRLIGRLIPSSRASACYWSANCGCYGGVYLKKWCCYDAQGQLHCGCVDYSDC